MNNLEILKELDNISVKINTLRDMIIKEETKKNKEPLEIFSDSEGIENNNLYGEKRKLNDVLKKYKCFDYLRGNHNFLSACNSIINKNNLSSGKIDTVFNNIQKAYEKEGIKNLEKYTYKCLNNVKK